MLLRRLFVSSPQLQSHHFASKLRFFSTMGDDALKQEIQDIVKKHKVVVFAKSWCPFCSQANVMLQSAGVSDLMVVEADHRRDQDDFMKVLKATTGQNAVPQVFFDGELMKGEKND